MGVYWVHTYIGVKRDDGAIVVSSGVFCCTGRRYNFHHISVMFLCWFVFLNQQVPYNMVSLGYSLYTGSYVGWLLIRGAEYSEYVQYVSSYCPRGRSEALSTVFYGKCIFLINNLQRPVICFSL